MKMMRLALVSCGLVIGGLVSGVTAQACYDVVYGPLCMGDDDELCISECASPYNPKICSKYTREVTERMPESQVTPEEIRSYLLERLAKFKVPKRIDFHESLPREDSGKIFKRQLRDPFWQNAGRKI